MKPKKEIIKIIKQDAGLLEMELKSSGKEEVPSWLKAKIYALMKKSGSEKEFKPEFCKLEKVPEDPRKYKLVCKNPKSGNTGWKRKRDVSVIEFSDKSNQVK